MKAGAAVLLALVAGCAGYGTADQYRWKVEAPPSVDRGADLEFRVRSYQAEDVEVQGVPFRFTVVWPGGPTDAIPRAGRTGETPSRIRARLVAGKAKLLVHAMEAEEKWVKVGEADVELK